jgi:uncharacterized membrane protein required for colicin V production
MSAEVFSNLTKCLTEKSFLSSITALFDEINKVIGWFDLVVIVVIIIGIWRGKKRGMSLELLDLGQWLLIIFFGAATYKSLSYVIANIVPFGTLTLRIISYLLIASFIKLMVTISKNTIGGKVVEGDIFGFFEYYLGMIAGGLRFSCILIFAMAILNAPYYSQEELTKWQQLQQQNFGSITFPTISSIQSDVFLSSWTGKTIKSKAPFLLIEPASINEGPAPTWRKREINID